MTYAKVGTLTPWASAMLTEAECRTVYGSRVSFVAGKSARGPWSAFGPAGEFRGYSDIRTVINLEAGEELLKGER